MMNYGKRKALPLNFGNGASTSFSRSVSHQSESEYMDDTGNDKETVKRKSRNVSEKKRRDQFNLLINELSSMVSNNRKIDKTTVLKTTIAIIKNHKEVTEQMHANEIKEDWKPSFLSNDEFTQLMLEALDGFILAVKNNGVIIYASDSVTPLLNHLPADLVNTSLLDFVHPMDKARVHNLLLDHAKRLDNCNDSIGKNELVFECHVVCGPGPTPFYELVECQGTFRTLNDVLPADEQQISPEVCYCCTVKIQSSKVIREMSLIDESKKEFMSRHSLEWKFLFLDHRGPPIIGYLPFEVLGTSGYEYCHPEDLEKITQCHEQLMQTGEGTSCYYRFLTKGQQWIWLQTRYYITYHQWSSKPEFIVCTNNVVSYAEVRTQEANDYAEVRTQEANERVERYHSEGVDNITTESGIGTGAASCDTSRDATTVDTSQVWPVQNQRSQSTAPSPVPVENTPTKDYSVSPYKKDQAGETSMETQSQIQHVQSPAPTFNPPKLQMNSPTMEPISPQERQMVAMEEPVPEPPSQQMSIPQKKIAPIQQEQQQQQQQQQQPQQQPNMAQPQSSQFPREQHEHASLSLAASLLQQQQQQQAMGIVSQIAPNSINRPMMVGSSSALPKVILSSVQHQLQEQLWQKHKQLQEAILKQQDELNRISEQLLLTAQMNGENGNMDLNMLYPNQQQPMIPGNMDGSVGEGIPDNPTIQQQDLDNLFMVQTTSSQDNMFQ